MLPSAKDYLVDGGLSPGASAYAVIGCFIGGVFGIQLVSRVMHHFIPSHVVDCDHTHEEHDNSSNENGPHRHNGHADKRDSSASENTPLLSRDFRDFDTNDYMQAKSGHEETKSKSGGGLDVAAPSQRPNLQTRLTGLVKGRKSSCADGQCLGYSDPCAQECFKAIGRNSVRYSTRGPSTGFRRGPGILRTTTAPHSVTRDGLLDNLDNAGSRWHPEGSAKVKQPESNGKAVRPTSPSTSYDPESHLEQKHGGNPPKDPSQPHHHHVPTNAFLSIGLQTSIAIALHKLPEGFITFATNHANPELGFTVFMALFIHNITEGFAMALPLYLAINSRWKAMFWSSLLGGVSQPLGAGIAALWFKAAGSGAHAPGETVYGCMFAITAGIMASVALQLFSESLTMTHNRNLCIGFAFLGMAILGFSFALTAG